MSEVLVLFKCGHTRVLTGNEEAPTCSCGEKVMMRIEAPAPTFVGHARGPCAQYEDLPAKAVSFVKDKDNG